MQPTVIRVSGEARGKKYTAGELQDILSPRSENAICFVQDGEKPGTLEVVTGSYATEIKQKLQELGFILEENSMPGEKNWKTAECPDCGQITELGLFDGVFYNEREIIIDQKTGERRYKKQHRRVYICEMCSQNAESGQWV